MTITIDFNKPATTDNYATAFVPGLQANMQALGAFLDPAYVGTVNNAPAGTKRWNSTTGLWEQWNGTTTWAPLTTGYALKGGDTFTGALTFANNIALQWKDVGGTARNVLKWKNTATDIYFGDMDNAVAGSVLHLTAQNSLSFEVNSAVLGVLSASGLTVQNNSGVSFIAYQPGGGEGFRVQHSGGFLCGYNTPGTTRTGYLQFNAGADVRLYAENGANLVFGTNAAIRMVINTGGNAAIGMVAPSAWGSSMRALELNAAGNAVFASSSTLYITNNLTYDGTSWRYGQAAAASLYLLNGGGHTFYSMPSGAAGAAVTPLAILASSVAASSSNGDLQVGYQGAANPWASSGRCTVVASGSTNALFGLIAGAGQAYLYLDGSNMQFNTSVGGITFGIGGSVKMAVQSNGVTNFSGGASTSPYRLGSVPAGAVSLDCTKSNVFTMTLTGNMSSLSILNITDGQTINVLITQDATGGRTWAGLTAANGFIWPGGTVGVLSTAANARDLLCLTFDSAAGKFYCTLSKGFA